MTVRVEKKGFDQNCEHKLKHAVIFKTIEKNLQTLKLSSKSISKENKKTKLTPT